MANWKKLLVSGSIAEFSHISSSGNIIPTDNIQGDLGSSNQGWNDLYFGDEIYHSWSLTFFELMHQSF